MVSSMTLRFSAFAHQRGDRRRGGADRGAFDQAGNAHDEQPGHEKENQEGRDAGAQQLELFATSACRGLPWHGRAEVRLKVAAHDDVNDEHGRHHQARQGAGQPQLADRLARDHAVEHQHHARRHQDAERTARLHHPGDHDLVVTPFQHFRQRDGGADGHAGDAERPFIAEITTISRMVPTARPPLRPPNQTWNMP